jgi:DeoR family suf operon transcriptional repressor
MKPAVSPGTRPWDILVQIARRGPATLAHIASHLGLARTSAQQHVTRLAAEGWLDVGRRRGRTGRPADVFSLSDRSRRLFARQSADLAADLIAEISEAEGQSKLRALMKGVARRTARRLRPRVGQGPPQERARRLAKVLGEEGALVEVTDSEGALRLTMHACPYHGLADAPRVLCDMEREMIRRLVGVRTTRARGLADGHPPCEFELAIDPADRPGRGSR